jgi:hypothetical protein
MKAGYFAAAVVVATLLVGAAQAACTQKNLAGKWGIYVQSNGGNNYAIACNAVISATGAISANNSACASTNGASTSVSGSIKLKSASFCDYVGTVTLNAFRLKEQFLRSTLSPDHSTLAGLGYEPASRVGYTFTMIRLP